MSSKKMRGHSHFLALWLLILAVSPATASVIGNWEGSMRSWNAFDMALLNTTLTGLGHTIEPDEAMTAANLLNNTVFVIGEPGYSPLPAEAADLQAWVQAGGVLLMFADFFGSGLPYVNEIAAGIGSAVYWDGDPVDGPIAGGLSITQGLIGQNFLVSFGTGVQGGSELAGTYVRWEQLGSGFLIGFGDRLDHDALTSDPLAPNLQFFQNIAEGPVSVVSESEIPEPSTAFLVFAGALALGALRRHCR